MAYLALAFLLGTASAQQPATFSLDPVFVSRFQPESPDLDGEAQEIRALLEKELGSAFLVMGRDEIPDFDDYSAEVYLQSCPPAEHLGCAFVVGEKGSAEWVVTGRVAEGHRVTVAFIDVGESRVVFDFLVDLDDTSEEELSGAVAEVLNQIISGAATAKDLREGSETDEERRRREADQRALLAKSLEGVDAELETITRTTTGRLEDPKLTKADLEALKERDDASPWERMGLTEAQYLRWRNSGVKIDAWRAKLRGREGRIVASASVGPAAGPWGQEFDGRKALSAANPNLPPVEVFEYQELNNGPGLTAEVEAAFGVHRWLQVGGYVGFRNAKYQYLFHTEVEGQAADVDEPLSLAPATMQVGARADFVPMSTWAFRPTGTLGVGFWKGKAVQELLALPEDGSLKPLDKPSLVLLEVGPGAELDLGPIVTVFGRALLAAPLKAYAYQEYRTGPPVLVTRPEPDGSWGAGFQLTAGVRVRVGPLYGKSVKRPTSAEDEEPEEELDE
jgi:hypothetical protein